MQLEVINLNLDISPAILSFYPMIHVKEDISSNSSSGSNSSGESSDVHLSIFPSNIFLNTPPLKVANPYKSKKETTPSIHRKVANPYPLIGETGVQSYLTGKNSKYSLASTN